MTTTNDQVPGDCEACPLLTDRRLFLRSMASLAGAALLGAAFSPASALATNIAAATPNGRVGTRARYDLPPADGVMVDEANEVIIARWQGQVYAFSSRCTHRGARLEWHPDEARVFCPKHKARFRADGQHDSGRSTRALDRYDVHLEGSAVVVDLGVLHRVDQDPVAWGAAVARIA